MHVLAFLTVLIRHAPFCLLFKEIFDHRSSSSVIKLVQLLNLAVWIKVFWKLQKSAEHTYNCIDWI